MSMKKYDAVLTGYLCVDLFPEFRKDELYNSMAEIFLPGKLVEMEGMKYSLGGLVANTGIAMKKFGIKVCLNGIIGEDVMGTVALADLKRYKLNSGIIKTSKTGTAFSIVIAPPGVDRIFLEYPGCNRIFNIRHVNFDAVSGSRLFHFGYPPLLNEFWKDGGQQMAEMFARVQALGVITSLDFSLPDPESESGKADWPVIMEKILPFTDIFVPGLEELLQIMDPGRYSEIRISSGMDILDHVPLSLFRETGRRIIDSGVKILLIKAGHRGACLLTGNISSLNNKRGGKLSEDIWNHREIWCNAYEADPSRIRNSSGAGDTAAAAFLTAVLKGESPEMALKYACIAGRNSLYCNDLFEELPGWKEMEGEVRAVNNDLVYM